MSTAPEGGGYHTSEDEQILHKLGYAQELFRGMGGFQNFAISFTIISILAGCLTSYYVAFERGGPVAITWGWLLVGLMSTIIALAMAEIASAYPTAGGLYYWASKLGSPGWGWATGWFNLIGQVAVTASIGYGLATFGDRAVRLLVRLPGAHERLVRHGLQLLGLHAVRDLHARAPCLINVFDIRITAGLNTISAYWHMVGVAFIVLVLIIVPDHHQSFGYVFGETVNASGYGSAADNFSNPAFWFVFGLGLLLSQYTITGFDASAHTAEETHYGVAHGGRRHVHVGRRLGRLRLDPAARRDVRDPEHPGRARQHRRRRAVDLDGVDEPELGRDPALHLRRRAVLLPHGVGHVGLADDVRVLARRRRPGPSALAARVAATACPSTRCSAIGVLVGAAHGAGDLELPRRLRGRHGDRGDRPLHRVHPPCLPAPPEGRQLGRAAGLEPRQALQVDRHDRRSSGSG